MSLIPVGILDFHISLNAEVHLYVAGHSLETNVGEIAAEIRRFLARVLPGHGQN